MLRNSLLVGKNNYKSERFQEEMIDLFGNTFQLPDNFDYRIITVAEEHKARPDLISKSVYGDTQYGDIICKINGISNPFELNEGMNLIIPVLADIPRFFQIVLNEEFIYDDDTSKSAQEIMFKKPNEKRKANEAILGDTRFKIDKENRVIIY